MKNGKSAFCSSRSKASLEFTGGNEGLDHLGVYKIAIELIELAEPEVVARKVQTSLRRIIGVAPQVAEVLHQHKRPVELPVGEDRVFRNRTQDLRPQRRRGGIGRQLRDQRV